ncbi:MAG: DUF3883 domain-containing protein [Nitrospirota bacterium]
MIDFDKLSLNQIIVFSEIMRDSALLEKEFIESRYKKSARNIDITIDFLRAINLITIRDDKIIPRKSYVSFLKKWQKGHGLIQHYIIKHFMGSQNLFYDYLMDFFALFRMVDDTYEFMPTPSQRLQYSGVRNFLIDLEVLYVEPDKKKYVIAKDYFDVCKQFNRLNVLSLDELLKNLRNKELVGNLAEKEIFKYERERLKRLPFLAKNIEHISLQDAAAGYDIKSYEDVFDTHGNPILRYIEVKAVLSWKYKFYWTRNEIEKAKIYRQKYYLYLLPVIGKGKFDTSSLKIIRDPYLDTYKNKKKWNRRIELFTFSL